MQGTRRGILGALLFVPAAMGKSVDSRIRLDDEFTLELSYKGQTVVLTAAEIFEALQPMTNPSQSIRWPSHSRPFLDVAPDGRGLAIEKLDNVLNR